MVQRIFTIIKIYSVSNCLFQAIFKDKFIKCNVFVNNLKNYVLFKFVCKRYPLPKIHSLKKRQTFNFLIMSDCS